MNSIKCINCKANEKVPSDIFVCVLIFSSSVRFTMLEYWRRPSGLAYDHSPSIYPIVETEKQYRKKTKGVPFHSR